MGANRSIRVDRIVARARAKGYPIRRSKQAISIGLPRLSIALVDDAYVPLGLSACRNLLKSIQTLRSRYTPSEVRQIRSLAIIARALANNDYIGGRIGQSRSMRHPLAGVLSHSLYYGPFVSRPTESHGLQLLRALLLRVITRQQINDAALEAATLARKVLVSNPTRAFFPTSEILASKWSPYITQSELAPLISPYLDGSTVLSRAFCEFALAIPTQLPAKTTRTSTTQTKRKPTRDWWSTSAPEPRQAVLRTTPHTTLPPEVDPPPPDEIPIEDLGEDHALIALNLPADDELIELTDHITSKHADYEYALATRHHLEGVLLPDTDRCLTAYETGRLWIALQQEMAPAANSANLYQILGATCAALMLVSARDRREVMRALMHCIDPSASAPVQVIGVTDTHWISRGHMMPALNDLPCEWFVAVEQNTAFPLPDPICSAIQKLQTSEHSTLLKGVGRSADWSGAWQSLRETLRQACPRYTETRTINTLPIAVYAQTGHLRDAQWIAGSSLEHSTAPLHYYSTSLETMQCSYREALRQLGILITSAAFKPNTVVGAPRSAIRWERAIAAVKALAARTHATVRLSKAPLAEMVEGVAALACYTAAMFVVCTAHRCTYAIAKITRRDLLKLPITSHLPVTRTAGLTLVADKSSKPELDSRLCVLPPVFIEQVDAYLRQLKRLERRLSTRKQLGHKSLRDAVRAALAGDGPLWFGITTTPAEERIDPLDRKILTAKWPEWEIPLPLLRHLFATQAPRYGLAGADVALQMGHAIDGRAFDACDPDTPVDFARRIADKLETYIRALGFEALATVKRHAPSDDLPAVSAARILHAQKKIDQAREQHTATPKSATDNERHEAHQFLETYCQENPSSVPNGDSTEWLFPPAWLRALIERLQNQSVGVQRAVRDLLDEQAQAHLDNTPRAERKRVAAIPRPQRPYKPYAEICTTHLHAAYWAQQIEFAALEVLDGATDGNDPGSLRAASAVLLPLYGVGCTVPRILALMDPNLKLHGFPNLQCGVVAEIPLHGRGRAPRKHEAQLITGDAVILLGALRRTLGTAPNQAQLDADLARSPAISALLDENAKDSHLATLLKTVGLARQVYAPGTRAAWEAGTLASVGPAVGRAAKLWGSQLDEASHDQRPLPPDNSNASRPAESPQSKQVKKVYRQITRKLHELMESGRTKSVVAQLKPLHADISSRYGTHNLLSLLSQYPLKLCRVDKCRTSTAYEYLTAIGARLIDTFGAVNVLELDSSELEETLRHIAVSDRMGRSRGSPSAVIAAILSFIELLAEVDVELDAGLVFEGLDLTTIRNPGYLASAEEMAAIQARLTNAGGQPPSHLLDADAPRIAECGLRIQMACSLRLREAAGLLKNDLVHQANRLWVHVHPIKRRGLKRLASKRVVATAINAETNQSLCDGLSQLHERRKDTGDLLLSTRQRTPITEIARTMSLAFREAAIPVLEPEYARSHIGRHNYANAAQIAVHDALYTSHLRDEHHFSVAGYQAAAEQLSDALARLPPRVRLRYASRQLGHGAVETTCIWYTHTLPLMHAMSPHFRGTSREAEAALLGQSLHKLETWRVRLGGASLNGAGRTLRRFDPSWLNAIEHETPTPSPELPAPGPAAGPTLHPNIRLLGRIALLEREGIAPQPAANEVNLQVKHYLQIRESVHSFDQVLGLHYLTGRRKRSRTHSRRPDAMRVLPLLERFEHALRHNLVPRALLQQWLLRQLLTKKARDLEVTSHDTAILTIIFDRNVQLDELSDQGTISFTVSDKQFFMLILSTFLCH